MNKILVILSVFLLAFASVSNAQFKQGDVELSFSGSASSLNVVRTLESSGSSKSSSDVLSTVGISFSPSYYFIDNLAIEGEFSLSATKESKPSQYLLVNLSYTYLLPETKTALFIHAGYGLSNSVMFTYMNNSIFKTSDKFDVNVINLGAGVKYLVTPNVLLHSELNYRIHSWKVSFNYQPYYSYSEKYNYNNISLLFGFSILL